MKRHHAMIHGESLVTETIECEVCGVEVEYNPAQQENRKYCSRECSGEDQGAGTKEDVYCQQCGDYVGEFWPSAERRFCGDGCFGKWRSENLAGENHPSWKGGEVEVVCDNCDETFYGYPSNIERSKHHFCSPECSSEALSGENHPRWKPDVQKWRSTGFWIETRRLALERDDYTCQMCGVTSEEAEDALQVHHITPVYVGGAKYQPENLTTLCSGCHDEAHDALNYPHWNSSEYLRFCERHEIEV